MRMESLSVEKLELNNFKEGDAVKISKHKEFAGLNGVVSRVLEDGKIEVELKGHSYEGRLEIIDAENLEKVEGFSIEKEDEE